MEEGDGYLPSIGDRVDNCEESPEMEFKTLKQKSEERVRDEDSCGVSNCCNDVDQSECVTGKINGEVGTNERNQFNDGNGPVESSKIKFKEVVKCSLSTEVGEHDLRKRKVLESSDPRALRSDTGSQASGSTIHHTGNKKRIISRSPDPADISVTSENVQHQNLVTDDPIVTQQYYSIFTESQSSGMFDQPLFVADVIEPGTPLTEYAQYLGLQPTVKFKCYRCGDSGFSSFVRLQDHQIECVTNLKVPIHSSQSHVPFDPSNLFRISRKVFLCSSCGTYYENWNLFLHMREVHKRFLCLYCLTMFSQSEMLALHLTAKHGIVETVYTSPEHLLRESKGPCFFMCCACEAIFTERDNFSNHVCSEKNISSLDKPCRSCGLRGVHQPSCRRNNTDKATISTSAASSSSQTDTRGKLANSNSSSQDCGASATKYLIPVSSVKVPYKNKKTSNKKHVVENKQDTAQEFSDADDDYDVSNAASFCHVNILDEPLEKVSPGALSKVKVTPKESTLDEPLEKVSPGILSNVKVTPKESFLDVPLTMETLSTNMSGTKKLTATKSESVPRSLCSNSPRNDSQLLVDDNRMGSVDKTDVNHDGQVSVGEQSLLMNKLLEVKNHSASSSTNSKSVEDDANVLSQYSKIKLCISPPPIEKVDSASPHINESVRASSPCAALNSHCTPMLEVSDTFQPQTDPDISSADSSKVTSKNASKELLVTTCEQTSVLRSKDGSKSPKTEVIDSNSQKTEGMESKSLLSPCVADVSQLESEVEMGDSCKLSSNVDDIDSCNSSPGAEVLDMPRSPANDLDSVDLTPKPFQLETSPSNADFLESALSPVTNAFESSEFHSTSMLESVDLPRRDVVDGKTSPRSVTMDSSKSPKSVDKIDTYKSPLRTNLNDSSNSSISSYINDASQSPQRIECQSPPMVESIPLAKSSLWTETNESSKSPQPLLLNTPSKSPQRTEFNDSSKSPSSVDLNQSPRMSPGKDVNNSCKSSPRSESESSKSPVRTSLLDDSSRSSSRDSSNDVSKSSLPMECNNMHTLKSIQDFNDTSCSHPGDGSKSPCQEELLDVQSKTIHRLDYSNNVHLPSTLADNNNAGNLTEKLLTCIEPNVPISSKLNTNTAVNNSSEKTNINIKIATTSNVATISRKRGKSASKSLQKRKLKKVADLPVELRTFGDEEEQDVQGLVIGKTKKKRRVLRGAKKMKRKLPHSNNVDVEQYNNSEVTQKKDEVLENIQVAGEEVPVTELHLEDDLAVLTIQIILQESVKTACSTCVYCNHAKKIAVNGKQLALHLLAEHKFLPSYSKNECLSDVNYLSSDESPLTNKNQLSGDAFSKIPTTEEFEKSNGDSKLLIDQYVNKLKTSLPHLQELFLNTDTYDSSDRTFSQPYDRTYECFHCNFYTRLHKELYVHNRKMHQKTILLCIMCKSNFYSYSELLCHLCPGIYVPDNNIKFRCHICLVDSLPSTFRLMVHLRKIHFVCDVCLETTDDQQKLSTHVWKHKLHHLCYRCGIAYRNKPDITKHLFWKHGTESVLCKKCLQKKWPHVYHFCIPPNAFVCEECNASFSRAVALKVHKRLHTGDLPHGCNECEEHFISKMLLDKHQEKHREIPAPKSYLAELNTEENVDSVANEPVDGGTSMDTVAVKADLPESQTESQGMCTVAPFEEESPSVKIVDLPTSLSTSETNRESENKPEKKSEVVDVYDLPPLNLSSESDDSEDDHDAKIPSIVNTNELVENTQPAIATSENENVVPPEEENQLPVQIVDGIWDNFQNYKADLERRESQSNENVLSTPALTQNMGLKTEFQSVLLDHDYCVTGEGKDITLTEDHDQVPSTSVSKSFGLELKMGPVSEEKLENDMNNSFDHDYCFNKSDTVTPLEDENKTKDETTTFVHASITSAAINKKQKSQKKKKRSASSSSSDSSSNSGTSSCSCGENCSCSSSSSSSGSSTSSDSDSSTSEGRRRRHVLRKERRERVKKKREDETTSSLPIVANRTPEPEELNQTLGPPEPEDTEVPIRESDLDTDETETDEDFYDKHPQLLANKLLAEKRNQLLLLAAVAPVNNIALQQEAAPPSTSDHTPPKKKVKSKKRKKRQHDAEKNSENKLKLNIPTNYYNYQMSNPEAQKPVVQSHPPLSQTMLSRLPPAPSIPSTLEPASISSAAESGSETDSKRLSKRRRVPKKFYGDSSDEDSSSHTKWSRKPPTTVISSPLPCPPLTPPIVPKSLPPAPEPARVQPLVLAISEPDRSEEEDGAETESEQDDVKKSSSESTSESEAEVEAEVEAEAEAEAEVEKDMDNNTDSDAEPPLVVETAPVQPQVAQKNENLYCYCQCPYDEVSEMIACDGKDCTIEWFHFECVGIMVPPKGKWFCPDCRKNMSTKNQYFS